MEPWDAEAAARHELAWPIRPFAERFAACADWPSIEELGDRLADAIAGHVTFVPSAPRRRHRRRAPVTSGDLYDGRIVLSREVPSRRRSWHDFFNALTWAAWPLSKRALHARQHEAIAARVRAPTFRLPSARTPEQDRLAMLDEGGVVLLAGPGASELIVFGHALFDHLREARFPVFARPEVLVVTDVPAERGARLALADAMLARALEDGRAPTPHPVAALDLSALSGPSP